MGDGYILAVLRRSTLFIADMVKKTEQAFGELAGSVEAILTLFFLSVTWLQQLM